MTRPLTVVWKILTEFHRWPNWNADVKALTTPGEVVEGFVFRWPSQITATVIDVRVPHRLVWTGKTMGLDAFHVWRREPRGDRTLVHTEQRCRSGALAQILVPRR